MHAHTSGSTPVSLVVDSLVVVVGSLVVVVGSLVVVVDSLVVVVGSLVVVVGSLVVGSLVIVGSSVVGSSVVGSLVDDIVVSPAPVTSDGSFGAQADRHSRANVAWRGVMLHSVPPPPRVVHASG